MQRPPMGKPRAGGGAKAPPCAAHRHRRDKHPLLPAMPLSARGDAVVSHQTDPVHSYDAGFQAELQKYPEWHEAANERKHLIAAITTERALRKKEDAKLLAVKRKLDVAASDWSTVAGRMAVSASAGDRLAVLADETQRLYEQLAEREGDGLLLKSQYAAAEKQYKQLDASAGSKQQQLEMSLNLRRLKDAQRKRTVMAQHVAALEADCKALEDRLQFGTATGSVVSDAVVEQRRVTGFEEIEALRRDLTTRRQVAKEQLLEELAQRAKHVLRDDAEHADTKQQKEAVSSKFTHLDVTRQAAAVDIADLRQQQGTMEATIADLKTQRSIVEESLASRTKKREAAVAVVPSKRAEVDRLRAQLKRHTSESTARSMAGPGANRLSTEATSDAAAFEAELSGMRDMLASAARRVDKLEKDRSTLQQRQQGAEAELRDTAAQLPMIQSKVKESIY